MALEPEQVAEFRKQLNRACESNHEGWESSRRLVTPSHVASTLRRLADAVRAAPLPTALRDALLASLKDGAAENIRVVSTEPLKRLTGLGPTKAVRALCLFFGLVRELPAAPVSALAPAEIERFLRGSTNPYDLLMAAAVASLLDLGAGDLSFAAELVQQHLTLVERQHKRLVVHCVERLRPGSKLGGRLHVERDRLDRLRAHPSSALDFRFWGDQDMFDLPTVKGIWPRYTLVTCHAPPTPTFAYEPRRIGESLIADHLRKTKGPYRKVKVEGEEALEVLHAGQVLIFPPWKFEIRGPLALLDLMSRRGKLCLLSAVDRDVFWEVLSQLLEDDRARPADVIFTPENLPRIFGPIHAKLESLPVGSSVVLSDLAALRQEIPRVLAGSVDGGGSYRFRYVEIRRGAVFDGLPASQTARLFTRMVEEIPPWMLILVPDP